jgi:N-acetylglutamate synthase-like GNAT family acetyltransferase
MTALRRAVVRPARLNDVDAIVEVHAAARERAYRGLLPNDQVVPDSARSRARWQEAIAEATGDLAAVGELVLVGEIGGKVAGVAATSASSEDPLELNALYVDPRLWRSGVGTALADHVFAAAGAAGFMHVVAWVMSKHAAAKAFYFARGWWLDGGSEIRGSGAEQYVVQRFRHLAGRSERADA